jgi:hypothetical protein
LTPLFAGVADVQGRLGSIHDHAAERGSAQTDDAGAEEPEASALATAGRGGQGGAEAEGPSRHGLRGPRAAAMSERRQQRAKLRQLWERPECAGASDGESGEEGGDGEEEEEEEEKGMEQSGGAEAVGGMHSSSTGTGQRVRLALRGGRSQRTGAWGTGACGALPPQPARSLRRACHASDGLGPRSGLLT